MKPTKGFTLIELVVVIVILGILAATALPKFVDLGSDSRKASLKALKAAIEQTSNMMYSKCLVQPATCSPSWGYYNTPYPTITANGQTYRPHFGYPENSVLPGMLDTNGFTVTMLDSRYSDFKKDGAPLPDECKVTYGEPFASYDVYVPGKAPSVVITDSGC